MTPGPQLRSRAFNENRRLLILPLSCVDRAVMLLTVVGLETMWTRYKRVLTRRSAPDKEWALICRKAVAHAPSSVSRIEAKISYCGNAEM
jgi:hypothetical protein